MRFGMRQIASEVSSKHPLENRLAEVTFLVCGAFPATIIRMNMSHHLYKPSLSFVHLLTLYLTYLTFLNVQNSGITHKWS